MIDSHRSSTYTSAKRDVLRNTVVIQLESSILSAGARPSTSFYKALLGAYPIPTSTTLIVTNY